MRIVKPLDLGILYKPYLVGDRFVLSVGAVTFFALDEPHTLLSEQALWSFLPGQLGETVFDAAMPKPRGEVLLSGACFAPGGQPCPFARVEFKVGYLHKTLQVSGDRVWVPAHENLAADLASGLRWVPSTAAPFSRMDLDPGHAFGGADFDDNPAGLGYLPKGTDPDPRQGTPLPNVEPADQPMVSPWDRPAVAGLGPLDLMNPARQKKYGTVDKQWAKEVYPADPADTDLTFYNMAPEDQQIDGFWQGDEGFVLTNMHPDTPLLKGTLPGLVPRCFVGLQAEDSAPPWREVPLRVETVWLFPEQNRGVMIHRGVTPINTFLAQDVEHLMLAYERLDGARRTPADYQAALQRRLDDDTALANMLRQDDLSPPEDAPPPPVAGAPAEECDEDSASLPLPPEARQALDQANQALERANQSLDEVSSLAREYGLEDELPVLPTGPITLPPRPATPKPPPYRSVADIGPLMAFADSERARLEGIYEESVARAEVLRAETMTRADQVQAQAEQAQAEAREQGLKQGLDEAAFTPAQDAAPPDLDQLLAQLEQLEEELPDQPEAAARLGEVAADLRGQAPAVEATLALARNPTANPDIKDLMRRGARHLPAPEPLSAGAAQKKRALLELTLAAGKRRVDGDLAGLDLSGMDLRGLDLSDVNLDSAVLAGANLEGVLFCRAVLARTDLRGARLQEACLMEASLADAVLNESDLSEANLTDAILDGAVLDGACLRNACLDRVSCHQSSFKGADLSGARGAELIWLETDLSGATLARASLPGCTLIKANLAGAQGGGCDLSDARLISVDLSGASLAGATLQGAALLAETRAAGLVLSGADARGLNLHGLDLSGARMDRANLQKADLGEATLRGGADLREADLRGARLGSADLRGARLGRANLMGGSLLGADLRGADLSEANLYAVETMFARTEGLCLEGAYLKRCKLAADWLEA